MTTSSVRTMVAVIGTLAMLVELAPNVEAAKGSFERTKPHVNVGTIPVSDMNPSQENVWFGPVWIPPGESIFVIVEGSRDPPSARLDGED